MYAFLSDFMYWLNSNILSFSDDITIPQKSLFLHTFPWDLNLFSVLKEDVFEWAVVCEDVWMFVL